MKTIKSFTKEKGTLELLDRSNTLLEATNSIAKVGGWELNLKNGDLYWTAETYKIHDTSPKEFNPSKDTGIDFYTPKSQKILLKAIENAISNGEGYELELELISAKGNRKHVFTNCQVTKEKGKVVKLNGAIQDITRRKKNQQELLKAKELAEEKEQYLKKILNHVGDPLFVKDEESRLLLVNDSFCSLFGLDREDILGLTLAESVPPEEREHFLKVDYDVIRTGEESIIEETLTLAPGETQTISTRKTRFIDKAGNKFLVGTIRDLTDRKKLEDSMQQLLMQSNLAIKAGHLGIWVIECDSKAVEWNEEMYAIYDLEKEGSEYSLQEWRKRIHPEDLTLFNDRIKKTFKGISVDLINYRIIDSSCNVRYIESSAIARKDSNGKLVQVIGLDVDITSKKEDILKLEKEKRLSDILLNYSTSGIYIYDFVQGANSYVNKQYEAILGYTKEEMNAFTSEEFMSLFHPEDRAKLENHMVRLASGEKNIELEYRFKKKNGRYIYCYSIDSPYEYNEEGKVTSFMGSFIEITELKELEKARNEAVEANRLKDIFLSNMSHEIRTPINGVIGFSELLKNEGLSFEKRKEYLDIIDRNSIQLLQLIDDIIDISKMGSNQLKVFEKDCDLITLLTDLESLFNEIKSVHDKPQVNFELSIPTSYESLSIISDAHRIRQVISNLLGNALKFSEEGIVKFGFLPPKGKYIEFFVEDEGIGIPEDKLQVIFERFEQAGYNTSMNLSGAGLGLTICKGIVELLGGSITVTSKLNVGTKFTFKIPFKPTDKRLNTTSVSNLSQPSIAGMTILIVEDGATARMYFKDALKDMDVKLYFAKNGKVAVDLYKLRKDIDLVLMDINMPVMNGFEAAQKILEIDSKAIIIGQSAYAMSDEKDKCFDIGFKDYLTKPILKEPLLKVLDKWNPKTGS